MKRLSIILIAILLTGCVSWMKADGLHKSTSHNFAVELPNRWMKSARSDYLLASRDGVSLQNILIKRLPIDKELQFTKKKFKLDMMPQEASEVFLDNCRLDQSKFNFKVIENIPCEINGTLGFRVTCQYKNKDGLNIKSVCYGLLIDKYFYEISYTAAKRYYFDKDIQTFEKVVKSFKLLAIS